MRLKNNRGNAFTTVIIALALFTIFVGFIFMQINNQIKFNKNTKENISAKYAAEAGIENAVLKIINQIESKTNTSAVNKLSISRNKNADIFAGSKKDLILAYDRISELNKTYSIFGDYLVSMYNVISNNYTSNKIDTLKKDMIELKVDLIILVTKSDYNNDEQLKAEIYTALDEIDLALLKLYKSKEVHGNHTAEVINYSSYGDDNRYVLWGDLTYVDPETNQSIIKKGIESTFLKIDGNGQSEQNYKLGSITKYYNDILLSNIRRIKDNNWDYKKQYLINSLTALETVTANSTYWSLETNIKNAISAISNVNTTVERYDKTLAEAKSKVFDEIDKSINDKMNEVEKHLYLIYIDGFNNNLEENIEYRVPSNKVEITDGRVELLRTILTDIEQIKIDLIELKCKLGENSINNGGSITLPDDNIQTNEQLYVEADAFECLIADNYGYTVQKINKTPLNVTYNGNKISKVDKLELEIVSIGKVQGKIFKRKATVEFTTKKSGDKFVTDYIIKSYDKY